MERPDTRQDAEADVEREEHPALQREVERDGLEVEERERGGAGVHVEREQADENERRSEQEIEGQLHRGVFFRPDARLAIRPREDDAGAHLARRTPDADEQIHRQDRELVEEKEDEEVERAEDAIDAGDEREEERVELLAPDL